MQVKLISFLPLQLNRFLLIYWVVVAVLRIILQTLLLLEIFLYHILESSPYEILYTLLEALDFGKPQFFLRNMFRFWFCCLPPLFSGSHHKSRSCCELVQAAEATRSERLRPVARRSVIIEKFYISKLMFYFAVLSSLKSALKVIFMCFNPTLHSTIDLHSQCNFNFDKLWR